MRKSTTFYSSVVENDKFYNMSPEAQALYFHIGMDSTRGHCKSPYRIARGLGYKIEVVAELEDNGFINCVDMGADIVLK